MNVDKQLDRIEGSLDKINEKLDDHLERIARVEEKQNVLKWVIGGVCTAVLSLLGFITGK